MGKLLALVGQKTRHDVYATAITLMQLPVSVWLKLLSDGPTLLGLGAIITIVPLLLTYIFGRYILRYDNVLKFAASLAGSRSADPTFGMLLQKTQSSIPTLPYAISYSIAQVTLTLAGPDHRRPGLGPVIRWQRRTAELWMAPLRIESEIE